MTLVFLRPRPLATSEQGDAPVAYVHEPMNAAVVVHTPAASSSSSTKRYKPFAGVLSPDNDAAYALAVRPLVADVVAGATACCFAYGHTNSGKTHTIFGYGANRGMYQRAAEELFTHARAGLLVQVRFYELYNGKVLDLLDDRRAGFVREDADGTIHVRSETTMGPNGEVRTQSLRACYFDAAAELIELVRASASARAAGTSELHAQSSRSHAILELEIVTHELARAREAVVEAQAKVVPVGKARDDLYIAIQSKLYKRQDDGTYVVVGQATAEESEQLARLEAQVRVAEDEVCTAQARVVVALAAGEDAAIGGKLVFVDLAGAEYTGQGLERNPKELREAKEINASLLALKECVRARASGGHTPYRNSKLTMLLRDHLEPKRAGRTVMIANVSSSAAQSTKAANTIKYAALVADAFRTAQ